MGLVVCFTHQIIHFARVRHFNLDKPRLALGRIVDQSGLVRQNLVDFHHRAGNGCVHVRGSLYGFDTSKRVALFEFVPNFWQVDKDNVTECRLGKVGNATSSNLAVDLDVFVGWEKERDKGNF
jgi:hypothetical protein